jgi:hypothetical protein
MGVKFGLSPRGKTCIEGVRVSENRVLRRILGPNKEEVTGKVQVKLSLGLTRYNAKKYPVLN